MNPITRLIAVTIAGLIVTTMVVLVVLISVGTSKAHAAGTQTTASVSLWRAGTAVTGHEKHGEYVDFIWSRQRAGEDGIARPKATMWRFSACEETEAEADVSDLLAALTASIQRHPAGCKRAKKGAA
jgi:hypothetical protein